ncbi:hypothetical protein KZC77_003897 [Shigella sonnei]|uniref:hypothetical protein n=1 Tax=Escherichia coli TaxID=562 RepID=UPI00053B221D|nr:hypothetical protein [Escherichia coli]EHU5780492.1 hypothetical protein [Shigella sonnei]
MFMTIAERLEEIAIATAPDDHELEQRLTRARLEYQAKGMLHIVKSDMGRFVWKMEELVASGYRLDKQHPPVINGFGVIAYFIKPSRVIKREMLALEEDVKIAYAAELEAKRQRMMDALEKDVESARKTVERHALEMSSLETLNQFTSDYDLIVDELTKPKS